MQLIKFGQNFKPHFQPVCDEHGKGLMRTTGNESMICVLMTMIRFTDLFQFLHVASHINYL